MLNADNSRYLKINPRSLPGFTSPIDRQTQNRKLVDSK
jgi:hypothetical protein